MLQTYSNFRRNQIFDSIVFYFCEIHTDTDLRMTSHPVAGNPNPRILLSGGSGFLGKAIVRELLSHDAPVQPSLLRIFDLKAYSGPQDDRIEMITADIRDAAAVSEACRGLMKAFPIPPNIQTCIATANICRRS